MQANETREMEAACHCGTVRFRVKLTDGFNTARRCTCSYCRMRGAVAVSADVGLSFSDRLDNGGRAGDRLELERHVAATSERARELGRRPANLAGCGIAHRLRRVGAEIGRAQHAGRRKLVGSRRRGACSDDCRRGKGEHSHMRSEPLYSHFASIRRGRVTSLSNATIPLR